MRGVGRKDLAPFALISRAGGAVGPLKGPVQYAGPF